MRKNKQYLHLKMASVHLLVLVVITACGQKTPAHDRPLSMIINGDSVTIYSGELKKNTPYQQLPIQEEILVSFFEKSKKNSHGELTLDLKLSDKAIRDGITENISDVINWAKRSGIQKINLAEPDKMDQSVFKIQAVPWAMIDSFRMPHKLELVMPKDEKQEARMIDSQGAVTMIIISEGVWFCYSDADLKSGKTYSREAFRKLLAEKKKQFGEKFQVVIKPHSNSSYKASVEALDEMTINKVERYTMVKLSDTEIAFLQATGQLSTSPAETKKNKLTAEDFFLPEPVEIVTPEPVISRQLTEDNAFLIEIRGDQSVWYQTLSKTSKMALQKVKEPVTENLKKIIADHIKSEEGKNTRYLIKGDKSVKYPFFEKVVNALKENNIHHYNLVTSE